MKDRSGQDIIMDPQATEVVLPADETIAVMAASVAEHGGFAAFGVAESICAALAANGITKAFPIQALTLPIALHGQDVIGQARTGTGKTLAFGIPIIQHIIDGGRGGRAAPRALVVVPTRELAIQVADDLRVAGSHYGARVVTLYGGRAYEPQIEALTTVDVVVGTPGRLLDLARQRQLDLGSVEVLVLDEADRMLDLGFLPDVEAILRLTPTDRQTMLFSATMPAEIVTLARRHLRRPTHIRGEHHDEPAHVPTTDQHVFRAHHLDKIEVLARVLQARNRGLTIVFCRTRRACDHVTSALLERGFAAAAVHGDLGQGQRERALRAFRSGKIDVLVATDVAARGLDVDDVTHVVNNECPEDEKAYLHRTGRTGRAGRTGVAVTFVDWQDLGRWKLINEALHLGHPDPLETYSTSEHLFSALDIPREAGGSLPRAYRERAGIEAEDLEDIGETGRHRSRDGGGRSSSQAARRGDAGGSSRQAAQRRGPGGSDGDGGTRAASGQAARRHRTTRSARRRTRAGAPVTPGSSRGSAQASDGAARMSQGGAKIGDNSTAARTSAKAKAAAADATRSGTTRTDTTRSGTPAADTPAAGTARANMAQANTVQANTVQANTAQANTVQANMAEAKTVQANPVQADTVKASAVRAKTAKASKVTANTAEVDTASVESPAAPGHAKPGRRARVAGAAAAGGTALHP
jgi:superfamily II DNA/RNA helicase